MNKRIRLGKGAELKRCSRILTNTTVYSSISSVTIATSIISTLSLLTAESPRSNCYNKTRKYKGCNETHWLGAWKLWRTPPGVSQNIYPKAYGKTQHRNLQETRFSRFLRNLDNIPRPRTPSVPVCCLPSTWAPFRLTSSGFRFFWIPTQKEEESNGFIWILLY